MTLQSRHSKSFIKRFPYDSQRTRGPNLGYDFLQHASTHMPVTPGPRVPRRVLSAVQGIPVNRGSIPGGFQLHFSGARVPFYSENHSRSNPSPFFLHSGPSHVSLSKMFPCYQLRFPPFSSCITLIAYSHWFLLSVFRFQPTLTVFFASHKSLYIPAILLHSTPCSVNETSFLLPAIIECHRGTTVLSQAPHYKVEII